MDKVWKTANEKGQLWTTIEKGHKGRADEKAQLWKNDSMNGCMDKCRKGLWKGTAMEKGQQGCMNKVWERAEEQRTREMAR